MNSFHSVFKPFPNSLFTAVTFIRQIHSSFPTSQPLVRRCLRYAVRYLILGTQWSRILWKTGFLRRRASFAVTREASPISPSMASRKHTKTDTVIINPTRAEPRRPSNILAAGSRALASIPMEEVFLWDIWRRLLVSSCWRRRKESVWCRVLGTFFNLSKLLHQCHDRRKMPLLFSNASWNGDSYKNITKLKVTTSRIL